MPLIYADLSALEYRLISHASRESRLIQLFKNDYDIHSASYETIFGRKPQDEKERKLGKTNNFLGVYGGGYDKFLTETGLQDSSAAKAAYKKITQMYPAISVWKEEILKSLWQSGFVTNLFGRRRHFDLSSFRSFEAFKRSDIAREAINWIIQGSGHDILKIFIMESMDEIRAAGLYLCLLISEVHDSFTLDCPENQVDKALEIVKKISANLNPLIEEIYGVKMKLPIKAKVEKLEVWK